MASDRDSILARRARFVASALAVVGLRAEAQPSAAAPACPPAEPPSTETRAEARAMFDAANQSRSDGDLATAADLFRRVYGLTRHRVALVRLAEVEVELGEFELAQQHVDELLSCSDTPEIEATANRLREKIELESAQVIVEAEPPATSIRIDGRDVPLGRPLRVSPGRHEIQVTRAGCPNMRVFEAQPGATVTVTFLDECRPQVCLEPPPPPPPPSESPLRFALGTGPIGYVALRSELDPPAALGARLSLSYRAPLGEVLSLAVGIDATSVVGRGGALFPVGADVKTVAALGPVRLAAGATAGYAFASFDRAGDARFRPRSSWFVEPYLEPLGLGLGSRIEAGLHTGLLWSDWENTDEHDFRLGYLTTGVFLRIFLGSEEPEPKLAWRGKADVARR